MSIDAVLPGRVTVDDVTEVASRLRAAPHDDLVLDLRSMVGDDHIDPIGTSLLGNLLLTSERSRRVTVLMPGRDSTLRQLSRGGLWFALAQRADVTIVPFEDQGAMFPTTPSVADLGTWATRWDPSDGEQRSRVWGLGPAAEGGAIDTVQREFVAFVNPHLSVSRDRLVRELSENVVSRWLTRLDSGEGSFASAATEIVNELLYNFSAHPFSTIPQLPVLKRDVPTSRRAGLVALFTTSGGGGDRLHLLVTDTGHGIPATLRPKFPKRVRGSLGDDRELLQKLMCGTLPPYGRGEGRGFPRLIELAREFGGTVEILTSETYLGIALRGTISRGNTSVTTLPRVEMAGTAVHVTLNLSRMRAPRGDSPPSADEPLPVFTAA